MKRMYLLFSHELTAAQKEDAKGHLGVEEFVSMPEPLRGLWMDIPAQVASIAEHIDPVLQWLRKEAKAGDVALIQGDFGAVYAAVNAAKSLGLRAVYATTKREVREYCEGDSCIKRSVFTHIRFREYL